MAPLDGSIDGKGSGPLSSQYRLIVATDLDHTLVSHEDPNHKDLLRFNALWEEHFETDCALIYSTGRSLQLYRQLQKETPLRNPNLLICSVGTEIYQCNSQEGACCLDSDWEAFVSNGWDRERVAAAVSDFDALSRLALQPPSEQRPHKVSYHCGLARDEGARLASGLEAKLQETGMPIQVIYSGGRDLDVIPARAGKGNALSWVLLMLQGRGLAPHLPTLVCGDSGNDIELFRVPGVVGCMVGNAMPELREFVGRYLSGEEGVVEGAEVDGGVSQAADPERRGKIYQAKGHAAAGIIEALEHFGYLPKGGRPLVREGGRAAVAGGLGEVMV